MTYNTFAMSCHPFLLPVSIPYLAFLSAFSLLLCRIYLAGFPSFAVDLFSLLALVTLLSSTLPYLHLLDICFTDLIRSPILFCTVTSTCCYSFPHSLLPSCRRFSYPFILTLSCPFLLYLHISHFTIKDLSTFLKKTVSRPSLSIRLHARHLTKP